VSSVALVLGRTVALGLFAGLVETALIFGRKLVFDASALGSLQMNRHALWMITASNALLFAGVGIALAVLVRLLRRTWVDHAALGLTAGFVALAWIQTFKGLTLLASVLLSVGLAVCFVRHVRPDSRGFRRLVVVGLPLLAVGALGLGVVHAGLVAREERQAIAALPAARGGSPNVLLIVLDTVRADALGCYGYTRDTTPNLDRLAARSIRFSQARAPGAWTLPSHASLLTGRWPHELSARVDTPLDGTYPTLAEHLASNGYATAGVVANTFFCNRWYGLGRGFHHYADTTLAVRDILRSSTLGRLLINEVGTAAHERPGANFARKSGAQVNDEFVAWLDRRDPGRPFFAFLNYFDAHDPYLLADEPERPFGQRPATEAQRRMLRDWHHHDKSRITPADVQLARDCYDDGLARLDAYVGRLLDTLEERGLDRETVIVVTADHGEHFGDHGRWLHGSSIYRACVHVPLLVALPESLGGAPRVIDQAVSLRDFPATVVDLAGLDPAGSPFPGRSWRRWWESPAPVEDDADAIFWEIVDRMPRAPASWVHPRAVSAGGLTYLRMSDGREELYETQGDPEESRDLASAAEHADSLQRLRALLREFEKDGKSPEPRSEAAANRRETRR
jgi:arylsulfatase A-like enzyme